MATATYDLIASQTLGSAAASITFSSIAASWTDLRLVIVAQNAARQVLQITFNSDTGSNYSTTWLGGDGSTVQTGSVTNSTSLRTSINGTSPSASIPYFITLDIFSYTGSTYKTTLITESQDENGSGDIGRLVSLWRSTAAITSIAILPNGGYNWSVGTTASLYGIKAA
jgi:hypothetical protein